MPSASARPARAPEPDFPRLFAMYLRTGCHPPAILEALFRRYGRCVRFQFRAKPDYLISDPALLEKILWAPEEVMARSTPATLKRFLGVSLLTSQGAYHRSVRRASQPAFHGHAVRALAPMIRSYAAETVSGWQPGRSIAFQDEMKDLALRIILTAIFGDNRNDENTVLAEAIDQVQNAKDLNDNPLFTEILNRLPLHHNRRLDEAIGRLDAIIARRIEKARLEPPSGPSYLSMLLNVRRPDAGGAGLDARQIRDEVVTLYAAGHETLSNALAWTAYLLGRHPEALARVTRECRAWSGDDSGEGLKQTRLAFKESFRLYPPVWIMGRRPVVDFEAGPYLIPKGSYIHISPYLVHRDPETYEEPGRFMPERWERPGAPAGPRNCAFIPFGAGTRVCIGEELAWMEALLILATVLKRWTIRIDPAHPVEPEWKITLRPRGGVRLFVEEPA